MLISRASIWALNERAFDILPLLPPPVRHGDSRIYRGRLARALPAVLIAQYAAGVLVKEGSQSPLRRHGAA